MPQPEPAVAVTGPLRTCIATGEEGAPERMIRFVVGPDGEVVPDLARRLPGRGMWVRAERAAVVIAVTGSPRDISQLRSAPATTASTTSLTSHS